MHRFPPCDSTPTGLVGMTAAAVELKIGKPTKIEGYRWTYEAGGEKLFLDLNETSIVVDVQPTRSALPSPSRSPIPAICHARGTPDHNTAADFTIVPFMSHAETSPVCACRHIKSAFPSPSKSPTPTICHARGTPAHNTAASFTTVPFISHTDTSPVCLLRDIKSPPEGCPGVTPQRSNRDELVIRRPEHRHVRRGHAARGRSGQLP